MLQSIKATVSEKKDNMVDIIMDAEASSVSLFNWEDRMYMDVDVGSVKKIMLTRKGSPLT